MFLHISYFCIFRISGELSVWTFWQHKTSHFFLLGATLFWLPLLDEICDRSVDCLVEPSKLSTDFWQLNYLEPKFGIFRQNYYFSENYIFSKNPPPE